MNLTKYVMYFEYRKRKENYVQEERLRIRIANSRRKVKNNQIVPIFKKILDFFN